MLDMVARAAPEQGLRSHDVQTRMKAVRDLKNQLIGNKFKKLQHLHLVPLLLELLASTSDTDLLVQSVATLGSLAYGVEDGVRAIVAADGITAIISALNSSDQRLVTAAARSLKLVYQSPLAPHEPLLAAPTLHRLVHLLQQPSQLAVATAAASVLGRCCSNADEAARLVDAGAVPLLLPLLGSPSRSCQEAALEALAAITEHSSTACQQLLALSAQVQSHEQQQERQPGAEGSAAGADSKEAQAVVSQQPQPPQQQSKQQQQQQQQQPCPVVSQLLQLSKQRDTRLRFLVARCISNFRPAEASTDQDAVTEALLHARRIVVPHLVRLLPAAAAAATEAAQDLEFMTQHKHHPQHPPFTKAASKRSSSSGSRGFGGCRGEAALVEAGGGAAGGDRQFLAQVPRVLAQLTHGRPELVNLAVELDAVKQLMAILSATSTPAAAAAISSSTNTDSPAATSASPAMAAPAEAEAAGANGSSSSMGDAAGSTTVYRTSSGAAAVAAAAAAKRARKAAAAEAATAAAAGLLQLRKGCLTALAALAMGSDAARQQMVDGRVVSSVVIALSERDAGVRGEAAGVLRGLSRSVRLLRGAALNPNLAAPLVALLQDTSSSGVQLAAAAAACNLVLGFSQVRPALVKAGVVSALGPLVSSMLPELRLHAVWAFKNLAFGCEPELQGQLLQELSWGAFKELLSGDDEPRVREQAVGLLQNLCKGGDSIDQVLQWSDGELLRLLEERLDPVLYQPLLTAAAAELAAHTTAGAVPAAGGSIASATASSAAPSEAQLAQLHNQLVGLLYAVANVCSGCERHKAAVMGSKIPQLLLQYLTAGQRVQPSSTAASSEAAPAACAVEPATAPSAVAATAVGAGSGSSSREMHSSGAKAAARGVLDVTLPAVWCVINLLWSPEATGVTSAAAAAGGGSGASSGGGSTPARRQQQPTSSPAATRGASTAAGSSREAAVAVAPGGSQADCDATMTAVDDAEDVAHGVAVMSRASRLRALGFEGALRSLLEGSGSSSGVQRGAAGASDEAQQEAAEAGVEHWLSEAGGQDLTERVQTALAQLGMNAFSSRA